MAEQTATFTVPMAARIAKAVRAVERAGLVLPQIREPNYTRPTIRQWLGQITAELGDHEYTVKRARIASGIPTVYELDAPQYMEVTARHFDAYFSAAATGDAGSDVLMDVGETVMVYELMDADEDDFATSRGFYFWRPERTQVRPAQIISSVASGAKWIYSVTFGHYDSSGNFTMDGVTVSAINTIETNNTSTTATGGDGVPLPPEIGTLTRLPVATGAVVKCSKEATGLYSFCVPNPFSSTCES